MERRAGANGAPGLCSLTSVDIVYTDCVYDCLVVFLKGEKSRQLRSALTSTEIDWHLYVLLYLLTYLLTTAANRLRRLSDSQLRTSKHTHSHKKIQGSTLFDLCRWLWNSLMLRFYPFVWGGFWGCFFLLLIPDPYDLCAFINCCFVFFTEKTKVLWVLF